MPSAHRHPIRRTIALAVLPGATLTAAGALMATCPEVHCVDHAAALIEKSPLPPDVPASPTAVHVAGTVNATTTSDVSLVTAQPFPGR